MLIDEIVERVGRSLPTVRKAIDALGIQPVGKQGHAVVWPDNTVARVCEHINNGPRSMAERYPDEMPPSQAVVKPAPERTPEQVRAPIQPERGNNATPSMKACPPPVPMRKYERGQLLARAHKCRADGRYQAAAELFALVYESEI